MAYYFEGADGQGIRTFSRQALIDRVTTILGDLGYTVGDGEGEFVLLKSPDAAAKRYKEGQPFLYFSHRPVKVTRKRLRDDSGIGHAGRRYDWSYIILVAKGNIGSTITAEQTETSTDTLMDQVRDKLEESYTFFRDLKFFNFKVAELDNTRVAGIGIAPLTVSFYNNVKLTNDELITV